MQFPLLSEMYLYRKIFHDYSIIRLYSTRNVVKFELDSPELVYM